MVTSLHSCLVTGLHSWLTESTYWVSHTVLCSVQHLGADTGAGAGTLAINGNVDMSNYCIVSRLSIMYSKNKKCHPEFFNLFFFFLT